jgi:hypothetical protein
VAGDLRKIDRPSHASTKERLRRGTLHAMRESIESELTLQNYQRKAMSSA